ncbi:unnamed protein product [Blepharisma stoltei]|uniref:Receptor ligand binding region domain-containing protein n=1 Tax=Blepharisma stoltei TaxID=1481888 RepID=A0AAU9K9W7_9CILI|nr:unnamed protein product [Blepharisma stoltei]
MNPMLAYLLFGVMLPISFADALNLIFFHTDTSSTASFNFLQQNQALSSHYLYSATNSDELLALFDLLENPKILIDLVDDRVNHYDLSQLCKEYEVIHLVVEDDLNYLTDWTFSGSTSRVNYLESLTILFGYFNWSQGIIFNSNQNTFIKDYLLDFSNSFKNVITEPNSNINDIVGRIAVPLGSTMYYIFGDEAYSSSIQQALIEKKLANAGNGIILGKESYFDPIIAGSLIIAEKNQENTTSKEIYISTAILKIINLIDSSLAADDPYQIKITLEKSCLNRFCQNTFSLVNFINNSKTIVGNFNNTSISLISEIIFPGNTTTPPISTKKTLPISINAGSTNYGQVPSPNVPIYARGTSLAIKWINEGLGILENFQMSLFTYDCGATIYDSTYGYNCFLKDIDKFGLTHVSSYPSGVVLGTLQTFKRLNTTVPIVSAVASSAALSSISTYPWFSRIQVSTIGLSSQTPSLLKALGWRSAAVLYQNETWGISTYLAFQQAIEEEGGITVIKSAIIPPALTRDQISNYSYILQEILDTNARLIIVFMYDDLLGVILEKFYDLGARNGDLIFFSIIAAAVTDIGAKNDTYRYKRIELGCPMMIFQMPVWVGAFGEKIYNGLANDYKTVPPGLSCNYFDSAFLIASSIDFMINRGQDFTDGYKLNQTIRSIKIIGCTGKVAISKGSNDRELDALSIDSNILINNTLEVYHIGIGSPYSTQYLTIANPFFYDIKYTAIKPPDLRNQDLKCPFPDSEIKTFYKGRYLVFGICFFMALSTSIITFFIWKNWWNVKIEDLKEKYEISFEDFIVGATIAIEFFQYLAMGPDLDPINSFLWDIGEALSLNLGNFIKLTNGVFWIVCDAVLGLSAAWIILCITVFYRLDEKYNHIFIFRFLGQLAEFLMPILGNLCFIPFVSILLDVFVCDESIGNRFTDSFLAKDCYQFCWKDSHIVYAILSGIAILIYEPLAVFCRPLWQEFQPVLHVKTLPLFLMVKTIAQIVLIVLNKTVKRAEAATHGFLFLLALLLYVIFIFKYKPYNYPRFSWWQGVSIVGVMWLGFIATISILLNNSGFPWIALVIAGWTIILTIGFYVQKKKYPSLLYKKQGKDTSILFKFAFQVGSKSKVNAHVFNNMKKSSKVEPSSLNDS